MSECMYCYEDKDRNSTDLSIGMRRNDCNAPRMQNQGNQPNQTTYTKIISRRCKTTRRECLFSWRCMWQLKRNALSRRPSAAFTHTSIQNANDTHRHTKEISHTTISYHSSCQSGSNPKEKTRPKKEELVHKRSLDPRYRLVSITVDGLELSIFRVRRVLLIIGLIFHFIRIMRDGVGLVSVALASWNEAVYLVPGHVREKSVEVVHIGSNLISSRHLDT
jgi:hypothetical protein